LKLGRTDPKLPPKDSGTNLELQPYRLFTMDVKKQMDKGVFIWILITLPDKNAVYPIPFTVTSWKSRFFSSDALCKTISE
jgi:hypothetical protein